MENALVEGDFVSLESRGESTVKVIVVVLGDGGHRGCGTHCNYSFCCYLIRGRTKFHPVGTKYRMRTVLDAVKLRISVKAQVMRKDPSMRQALEKSASMPTRLTY